MFKSLSRFNMLREKDLRIELNLFYMHFRDSVKFLEFAKTEKSNLKSFFARHSILSNVFSSEALINRIYSEFYIGEAEFSDIERISTQNKWLLAPLLCRTKKEINNPFNKGCEPFQSFNEIIKIRHWLVHPKSKNFLKAKIEGTYSLGDKFGIPYIKLIRGKNLWPHTKIPINPFEIDETHAEKVLKNFEDMLQLLLHIFEDVFDKKWLLSFSYVINDEEMKNSHIEWLWSGYTPEQ